MFVDLRVSAIDRYHGTICSSPDPNWSFNFLAAELNSIEDRLRASSPYHPELRVGSLASPPRASPSSAPEPPKKPEQDIDEVGREQSVAEGRQKMFVMRAPMDDEDESECDGEESPRMELVTRGTQFSCTDLYLSESDGTDDELETIQTHSTLMRRTSIGEELLLELERENQLKVKEEVRTRLSKLEVLMTHEYEKSAGAILQIDKHTEARRGLDRLLDSQYKQKVAEELDHHLAIIQRHHAQRSQAEEMRIRKDAAVEARRKEKALQDEQIKLEKAKAKAEARKEAARIEEEAKKDALDAEERALKEAAEKENSRISKIASNVVQTNVEEAVISEVSGDGSISHQPDTDSRKSGGHAGIRVKASSRAIKAEESRFIKHRELIENNAQWMLSYRKEVDNCERQINKRVRQITYTVENVRSKASELLKILKDPGCPPSLSLMMFAKKVVGLCENPSGSFEGIAYACGHVILLVASQIPAVMDIVLGEFHSVCIYTVPKHVQASETAARSMDYWKLIGYREENGKLESSEKYLGRIEAYMKLYGALVQVEPPDIQNPLGLKEGWAWLARFLNELPATAATATALHAFLKMTGFALFQKYKSQFRKILAVISGTFLPALKELKVPSHGPIISNLELFIDNKEYLKEPEGRQLRTYLSSRDYI